LKQHGELKKRRPALSIKKTMTIPVLEERFAFQLNDYDGQTKIPSFDDYQRQKGYNLPHAF